MVDNQPIPASAEAREDVSNHAVRTAISPPGATSAISNSIDRRELGSTMPWFKTGEQLLTEKHPIVMVNSPDHNGPSHKIPRLMTADAHAHKGNTIENKGHYGGVASAQKNPSTPAGCIASQRSVATDPPHPNNKTPSSHPTNSSHPPAKSTFQANEIKRNDTHLSEQDYAPRSQMPHGTAQHAMPQFNNSTSKHIYAPTPSASQANERKTPSTIQGLINQASQFLPSSGSPAQVQHNTPPYQPSYGIPPPAHHTVVPSQKPLYPQVGIQSTPPQAHYPPQACKPQAQRPRTNVQHVKQHAGSSMGQKQQHWPSNNSSQPKKQPKLALQPPSRPTTPKGTIIKLPANRETAESVLFERNGKVINLWGLARWALYHADWAEYLRTGGGDTETWWLYRRWKGLQGYSVSGYKEQYDGRISEIVRQAEARRSEARLIGGMIGPPPLSSTFKSSSGPRTPKGTANAVAQNEQFH